MSAAAVSMRLALKRSPANEKLKCLAVRFLALAPLNALWFFASGLEALSVCACILPLRYSNVNKLVTNLGIGGNVRMRTCLYRVNPCIACVHSDTPPRLTERHRARTKCTVVPPKPYLATQATHTKCTMVATQGLQCRGKHSQSAEWNLPKAYSAT